MAFVHRQSCEGVKSELDLFAVPPTQTSIEHGGWIEHQPITSLDSGGPIEFVVPGAGDAYIDLANTYLLVRAKVVRGVGTDIADDTPVAPVNNWLHSLFSQVDVHLNDTLVTPSSNTYPFRAYVETLLSYGAEAKKTQLTSQLWYKDTAGHMEATQENGGNAGLVERRRHILNTIPSICRVQHENCRFRFSSGSPAPTHRLRTPTTPTSTHLHNTPRTPSPTHYGFGGTCER